VVSPNTYATLQRDLNVGKGTFGSRHKETKFNKFY